ncbi:MAG: hypothetical protein DRH11_14635 [Deltaproteobacteria bacterium]|nr:L,D-transpeptidase [Deltaproteobacteria bacterium]MBW1935207.1 L,D-transpeptidase [Deltaproteobacteria bacterium]RLB30562.1 MAG: hypothetical protein DRH11_14635 [Deltaproteobacteria bacterium]
MKRTMPKMLSAFRLVRLPRAIIFFLLAFPLIMVGPGLGFAEVVKKQIPKIPLVPEPLLKWPERGSDYAVLVDKSRQKVFVYHRASLFKPAMVFRCSTGENDGPKSRRNDRRTPEGIYFFTRAVDRKYLTPIYGVRALPINYPNPLDKIEGRDGYGIWFHGTNKELKPKDTNGCIALENQDIEKLASIIKLKDTPVIIDSKIKMVPPETLRSEAAQLENLLEEWRKAWERKQIDKYMSFYNSRFRSSGKNWYQWKKYKESLAQKYGRIKVRISNLRLLRNSHMVLARFRQTYVAPSFQSQGEKTLFLKQNSKEWRIVAESFEGGSIRRMRVVARPLSYKEEIGALIKSWETAWESKNLKKYLSFYDARFRSRGMSLRAWKNYKAKLNKKYSSIQVEIKDLKIRRASRHLAEVQFKQLFKADQYRDFGFKRMLLVKRGKHWKIKREEWKPLKKASRL